MTSRPQTTRRGRRPSSRRATAGGRAKPLVRVAIADRQRLLTIDRRWLGRVVRGAVAAIGAARAEIGVAIVDDAGIARLHDRWMGLSDPTDVLTFDLAEPGAPGLHGDIAVSAETARRVARDLGWQPRHELAYYVVHGLLHLAGENDLDPAARRRMRARERAVLAAIDLPEPPRRRPGGRGAR